MSVLQSIYVDPTVEAQRAKKPQADGRPAPSSGEVQTANMELQQDRSGYNRFWKERYDDILQALDEDTRAEVTRTDGKFRLPTKFWASPQEQAEDEKGRIWGAMNSARQKNPALFRNIPATREEYDAQIYQELVKNRATNKDVAARSSGFVSGAAGFVGGMIGSQTDPVNAVANAIPGGGGLLRQVLVGGLANMGAEAATIPGANAELGYLGDSETAGEQVGNVLLAGAAGVAFPLGITGTIKVGGKTIDLSKAAYDKVSGNLVSIDKRIAQALGKESFEQVSDADVVRIFSQGIPAEYRTPAQADALTLLERRTRVTEENPYRETYADIDVHLKRADEALARVSAGIVTGRPSSTPASPSSPAASFARVKALIRGPESGGNDLATNALGSSASGRYQFIEDTFKSIYKRVYGGDADAAWNSQRRFDVQVQERLMDRLLADNAAVLQRQGVPVNDGNLYVMHVLGSGNGPLLFRSDPNADVASVIRAANPKTGNKIVSQNPTYFGGGKTVGEALATIRSKVGGEGAPVSGRFDDLGLDEAAPVARPAALDAVRPVVGLDGNRAPIQRFRPADIDVDAGLMQFKSGGDAQGVTQRLQGIQQWDEISAGAVTVWEAADGRRLIADGHQRLGLAKRMIAADQNADIQLNAFVLREADGITASDARIITALKNIGEGSGTTTDAAKIFREGGEIAEDALRRRLPPTSVLVRDGKSLSRLSDEAFGAVVNDVVPESWGAVIGSLAPDPATHIALIDLLANIGPPNRRQAESIVRQAMQAGFARETQEELFGSRDVATALFGQRAKVLDKGLAELRKLKGVFSVAGRNSDVLAGEGSQIDVARAAAAAQGNANALEIVERLAHSKGDVSDLLNAAAKRLANGEPIGRVVTDFVAEVRKLDLKELGRDGDIRADGPIGGSGEPAFGSGRGGLFDDEVQPALGDQFGPDGLEIPRDAGGLTAAERDTLEFDEPDLGLFDAPNAAGPIRQADGAAHDLKAALDDDGLGDIAFGVRDGETSTVAAVLADIDAEDAALKALRDCL